MPVRKTMTGSPSKSSGTALYTLSLFTMCQMTLFVVMTSFMACHSQVEKDSEVEVYNFTRTATDARHEMGLYNNGSPKSTPRPPVSRRRTTASDVIFTQVPLLPPTDWTLCPELPHRQNDTSLVSSDKEEIPKAGDHGRLDLTSIPDLTSLRREPDLTPLPDLTSLRPEPDHTPLLDLTSLPDLPDLMSLFTSPSPADILEDADMADLFNDSGVVWTTTSTTTTNIINKGQVNDSLQSFGQSILDKGLVSKRAYQSLSTVVLGLVVVCTVVGLVSNAVALKVFRGLGQSVTSTYMICLCSFDIAFLIFVVVAIVAMVVVRWLTSLSSVARGCLWLYDFAIFLAFIIRQVVIVTTALMSLERYFFLTLIFKTRRKASLLRRPRLLVALCSLLAFAVNFPMLLKREVSCRRVEGVHVSVCYLAYTSLYLRHRALWDDLSIVSSCLFQYLPLIAMLMANIALIISLHRYTTAVHGTTTRHVPGSSSEEEKSNTSNHRYEPANNEPRTSVASISSSGTTSSVDSSAGNACKGPAPRRQSSFFSLDRGKCVTVIVYSLLFFFLALPLALLPVLKRGIPEFHVLRTQHYLFLTYVRLFNLLDSISASINFFVFFAKGGAFRTSVMKLVRCRSLLHKKEAIRLKQCRRHNSEQCFRQTAYRKTS